jgi:lipoate-protein ligase B
VVLLLEHPPVFTLGRRGGLDNLTVSRGFLDGANISIVQAERGGDITYHGPGQLVGYPIVHLWDAGLKVVDFVAGLEEVMLRVAADWGIPAVRSARNRGVWVGEAKLGSIGITVRRGVSFHGFALNVDVDLEPFCWINPCGLKGVGVVSMAQHLGRPVALRDVRRAARGHMADVFHVEMDSVGLDTLERLPDSED